ncbi:MAG: Dihydrofolate reductase, partial [uncultured Ramlibacter sp.]
AEETRMVQLHAARTRCGQGRGCHQGSARPRLAGHRQCQPPADPAGCITRRRVQRVDLPGGTGQRQAPVRSRCQTTGAAPHQIRCFDHRRLAEHLRTCRRGTGRFVRTNPTFRQGGGAPREAGARGCSPGL